MPRTKLPSARAQGKRKMATPRSRLATLPEPKAQAQQQQAPAKAQGQVDMRDIAYIGVWTDYLQPPGEETYDPPRQLVIDEPEKPAEEAK